MIDPHLQTAAQTLFDSILGLKVRPRFCRAEGPTGLHRSPQRGDTVEFSEYRPYIPGAELRFLDWKLYARSDRLYIKSFCDERASRFLILIDDSLSMNYPLEGACKLEQACVMAMGLAFLAGQRQKDAVNVAPLSRAAEAQNNFSRPMGALIGDIQSVLGSVRRSDSSRRSAAPPALAESLSKLELRQPTTVIFISDMYEEPAALQKVARLGRRSGHEFWFLQILSKEEIALPFETLRNFVDLESHQRLQMDPSAIRVHYSRALHDHLAALRTLGATGRYALGILGHDPAETLKRLLQD